MDSVRRLFPDQAVYTFWDYLWNAYGRNAGLRLDHILLSPRLRPDLSRVASTGMSVAGKRAVTMRRYGSA
ncbi:hypothetical protein M1D52_20500 [Olivibacter sp. SA151]|uniref:hypothetical protein n=1 Tax=Olivibacter jilunii TaxID=985016 RepID=UPI003F17142A